MFTSFCNEYLNCVREEFRKSKLPLDGGFTVNVTAPNQYIVRDAKQQTVWTGESHCYYCARVNALAQQAIDAAIQPADWV
jgi:hypothetical protein